MEILEEGPAREGLRQHLEDLDNSWPLVVVAFSAVAITVCWVLIPPGT
jgi:hypothetical protein